MPNRSVLSRFLLLYGALFAAFGVASPFLPALMQQDGLGSGALGVVLAAGTGIRLLAGPAGGRLADRTGRAPAVLSGLLAAAAAIAFFYLPARGLVPLLLISVAHAAVLAPLTPVADALALGSAQGAGGFQYGTVRAMGSAAFIAATLASGQLVEPFGLGIVIWLNGGLLALAACLGWLLPNRVAAAQTAGPVPSGSFAALLRIPAFVRLMAVAALIGGSHALHDGFEVIRWRTAGLSPGQVSTLWAMSVAAEVFVFLLAGPVLLRRLGAGGALILSAVAGVVRWGVAAQTAAFPAMALVEPLHGLTFALMHLACMSVIGRTVPAPLAATAQAFYATVAVGAASAVVTLAGGRLYGDFGGQAFWAMALLCGCAVPLAWKLRQPNIP